MAASDARPIPRKNTAYRVTFPILDADGDLVTGATGLDSEVSKDGGTFADCTNEATEIATSSGMYYLDLTADEMNADTVAIIVKTSSSGAKTTPIVLYPEELGDVRVNVGQWNGTGVPSEHTAGYPIVTVKDGTGTGEIDTASGRISLTEAQVDQIVDEIWDEDATAHQTQGTFGQAIGDPGADSDTIWALVNTNLNATVGSRASQTSVDTLATYVDTEVAAVLAAVDTEVASILSDTTTLLSRIPAALFSGITSLAQWLGLIAGKQAGNATARTELRATGAGGGTFDETTDSLEAVRDRGDAAWTTATGFSTLTQADVRTAIGMSSANMDAQLAAIVAYIDTEVAAILAAVDTEIAAIKGKTDQLTFTSPNKVDASLQAAADLVAAVANKIADHVRRRTQANVEASSDGDALDLASEYGLIQQAQESSLSGATMTVRKTDGVTTLGTKTVTTSASADPITGVS